jgi:hypothetical protein
MRQQYDDYPSLALLSIQEDGDRRRRDSPAPPRSMTRWAAAAPHAPARRGPRDALPDGPRLRLQHVDESDIRFDRAALEGTLGDARRATTRVRRAHVAASLAYAVWANGALVATATSLPLDARLAIAYLVLAPELVILTRFLGLTPRRRLMTCAAYALTGERGSSVRGHAQQPVALRWGAALACSDLRIHTGGC